MVNGDTVHRDAIERRLVSFGVDGFTKHRPDTVIQCRFPSGKWIHTLENQGLRLGDFSHGTGPS